MDIGKLAREIQHMAMLSAERPAYYLNSDDYEALKAAYPQYQSPGLCDIVLIPRPDVPPGTITPAGRL